MSQSHTSPASGLLLFWLTGASLRITVLAVPPLLPTIHRALHLDETEVGALTALPVLLLAAAALLGSVLIAHLGARRTLIAGLVVIAAAGAVRGVGSLTLVLFAMTLVMGVGISVAQPTLPTLIREWFPVRAGLTTAAYSNGLLIGEIVSASLTVPLILPLVHAWQPALAAWSVLPVLAALWIAFGTPHVARDPAQERVSWWPDWHSGQTWRLGLALGCASTAYFGANAFIPDYLKAAGHSGLITAALTSLNLGQLPASLIVAASPRHFVARRWPLWVAGCIMLVASLGLRSTGAAIVAWAGVLGFSSAIVLVLTLALPPLLADERTVHHLSAAMFAICYTLSFSGTLIGGALWDLTGVPTITFLPVIVAGPVMLWVVRRLDFHSHLEEAVVPRMSVGPQDPPAGER